MAVTFTTTALFSKSVPEHPVKGRASGSQVDDLLWILSWLALSNGTENRRVTDLSTLGTGKGRQVTAAFCPTSLTQKGSPVCGTLPLAQGREGALGRQRPSLDIGPCLVSELSEWGEHS